MRQSSSGPPADELTSPVSPPLHEQGLPEKQPIATMTVTAEQLSNSDFLFDHPAPHRLSGPSPGHLLYFEVLLKEAAALMTKVQKHQSAANNIRSPTWEKASLTIEECSRRIRAICTYTGVPASHLSTKKELAEIKKAKELQDQIAAEAVQTVTSTPAPALPQQSNSISTPKRKTPFFSRRR
ncbi:hypothetical protein CDAR_20111 [Caerostris darwini]|uniref:Uncharacterized protein n=1 Tax=Caerostris darwini TaxID=1538125 RepID=A0AAV4PV94_9ARAC|nr:hypothetical protein CDAR_20111 [Caerostris darwini]